MPCLCGNIDDRNLALSVDTASATKSSHLVRACGLGQGVIDRRDALDLMHGRSRMTIGPRILTIPGRNMSGIHRPGRHCLHQARSAVRCLASRMKGELHPAKNRW